jgi:hypothetical protein
MIRHARLTLPDEVLDQLHVLKRRLARERGHRVNIDEVLREGVELLLRYYSGDVSEPKAVVR